MNKIFSAFKAAVGAIWRHKIISIIVLIIIGGGGYFAYNKWLTPAAAVRYITAAAERGVLINSISGTGQVSASNQVDISAKTSGDVTSVSAKVGQEVKSGALIASLNAKDAYKSVRDAQAGLESALLSLKKIEQPADDLTIMQSENSLAQAEESKEKSESNLAKAYEDGFNSVANIFLELPGIMTGMNDIIYGHDFDYSIVNIDWYADTAKALDTDYPDKAEVFHDSVVASYESADGKFDSNFDAYKAASRSSSTSTIENLILQTYDTARAVADAIKNTYNMLDYVDGVINEKAEHMSQNIPSLISQQKTSLEQYTGLSNSHLSDMLSSKQTIIDTKKEIIDAERTIAEKTISLADLKAGTDALDLESQRLAVRQKQNSLADAREKLADYSIRAPFDGVIAALDLAKGDSVSAGASLGTLITKQRIVTVALNEVDIAKVAVGQSVSIAFDAIDGLNITGEVVQVDAIGTVSQGVVSYNVKVAFDVQDERVKPGMSVSVNIILSSKPNVIMVSTAAIKTSNGTSYVNVLVNGAPQAKTVTTGDSNDTMTEIVSGVNEGDAVVTQTVGGTTTATKTTSSNGNGGGPPGGGLMMGL
jgi:HlyD family secretion protein